MSKCILIAEDNEAIGEYCRDAFQEEGYRVLLACDGWAALALFDQYHPDVVILDIIMPVMTGLEALEHIRRRHLQIPVILFTAYDEDCLRDNRGALATACVEKSVDLTTLKRCVVHALRSATTADNGLSARIGLPPPVRENRGPMDRSGNMRPDPSGDLSYCRSPFFGFYDQLSPRMSSPRWPHENDNF